MRRAVILAVVFALVSITVTPVGAQAVALASRPALSLTGAALIPDTFAGYIGLVGGEQLPQALAALRAYMGAPAEPDAVMQQVVEAIFPEGDIDYAADIAPWLGDQIALGVNPAGPDEEPDFVALLATNNTALSDAFVQKLIVYYGNQGVQIAPIVHQSAVVYTGGDIALATVSGHVAYGSLTGVQAAIDVSAGAATPLSETPGFEKVASGLASSALLSGYLSGAALDGFLAEVGLDLSPLLGDVTVEGVGFSVAAEGAEPGRLDLALGWSQQVDGPVINTATAGAAVSQALPEDALGFVASYDVRWPVRVGLYAFAAQAYIDATLNALAEGEAPPELPTAAQLTTQANGFLALANLTLTQQLGAAFDIETNILQWMSGEYAIGFLRNPSGLYGNPRLPYDFALMAQVIDRNASLNTVEVLSRVLASQMQLVPVIINMGGYDLRAVPDPSTGGNLFVYGLVGDFLVLATGNGVEQLIAVASGTTPSLASNETWQGRAMDLAPAVEGVFYFAIADFVDYVRAALTGDILVEFEEANAPVLEPFDYVLASADMRDGGLWTLSVLVKGK